MAGNSPETSYGGGQRLGVSENDATANGRSSGWGSWASGIALSTVVCSDATCVSSSHGGDKARRRRASAMVGDGARACEHEGE